MAHVWRRFRVAFEAAGGCMDAAKTNEISSILMQCRPVCVCETCAEALQQFCPTAAVVSNLLPS